MQPNQSLPKSLQVMIAEAQEVLPNFEPDDSTREYFARLARGEYKQRLYWECVAEDCEEAGNWDGAKAAYRRIIDLPKLDDLPDLDNYKRGQAYAKVAAMQRLLGENDEALESIRTALDLVRKVSDVLARCYLCIEASQLIQMNQIDEARQIIDETLAIQDEEKLFDHLGTGKLLMARARCELASGDWLAAGESLEHAWECLEAIRAAYEDADMMQHGLGIVGAFANWWQVSAKRSALAGDDEQAIDALCKALDLTTQCAESWSRFDFDGDRMSVLRQLAAAYSNVDRFEEASEAMQKANEVQARRRFPT